MPRSLFGVLYGVTVGIPLLVAGMVMMGWAGVAHFDLAERFDAAAWLLGKAPLLLGLPQYEVANGPIQDSTIIPVGMLGLVLCLAGVAFARGAWKAALPKDRSESGGVRIEFETAIPRVGQPLVGRLRLPRAPRRRRESYRLMLACRRTVHREPGHVRFETRHQQEIRVAPVQDEAGWVLPFAFEIPGGLPGSEGRGTGQHGWRLEFAKAGAWITFYNGFDLYIARMDPGETGNSPLELVQASVKEFAARLAGSNAAPTHMKATQ